MVPSWSFGRVALIGAGHLGKALCDGWRAYHPGLFKKLVIGSNRTGPSHAFAAQYHVPVTCIQEAVNGAEAVILCVPPRAMPEVCDSISDLVAKQKPLIISLAAATSIERIAEYLRSPKKSIVRGMPTTLVAQGKSPIILYADAGILPFQKKMAKNILGALGPLFWVQHEQEMMACTAAIGCGPAYFYRIIQEYIEAAIKIGVPSYIAQAAIASIFSNAADQLLRHPEVRVKERIEEVATPGGLTEAGLAEDLKDNALAAVFTRMLQASRNRGDEIATRCAADYKAG